MQAIPATRISYLDSSRGLAALAVLLAHFQPTIIPSLNDSWVLKTPLKIISDGEAAVLYFFILSGYVLTLSLKSIDQISFVSYFRFVIKRIFRIFPAFLFVLLCTFFILKTIEIRPATWLDRFWTTIPDYLSLFKESLLIVRFPNEPLLRLIPQDWTLSIEISISLLLPAIALAIKKKRFLALLFIYFAIQFLALDDFIFDFSLGVFLACEGSTMTDKWKSNRYKVLWILLAIFLISVDYAFPNSMKYADLILIHHKTWGLAIILLAIISSSKIQRFLSAKPLVFLGKISYSFYLFHMIVLLYLTTLFSTLAPVLFLILSLTVTIVISTFTYMIIEKPFNRIPGRVFRRFSILRTHD